MRMPQDPCAVARVAVVARSLGAGGTPAAAPVPTHPAIAARCVQLPATGEWAEPADVKLASLSTSSRSGSCFCDGL
jgi:hypothetical protein